MKKFFFWIEHHWVVPIILLLGYLALSNLYFSNEEDPWWFWLIDVLTSMMFILTSLMQYVDWRDVFKQKYAENVTIPHP